MCGIIGIISYKRKINKKKLDIMLRKIAHRGPDDRGLYISDDKKVALGNTRLSIIDLSERARQPMCNEDETLWIVYNGEIYNYKELRKELIKNGHKFRSDSDTEVILHLYEEEGEKCLNKLRGIFAFAIWDDRKKELFIARDKMGVKPIYYYIDENFLIFSSEVKAILSLDFIKKDIDFKGIEGFLLFGSMPFPDTIFRKIKLLTPASFMILKNREIKIKRYWYIKTPHIFNKNKNNIKKNLYNLLDESIRINLIADVPVGVFLSGGLDSGTLLYFVRKNNKNTVKTFSIVFKEKEFDERNYSSSLAQKFNTEHYENEVTQDDMRKELEKFINFMDLPSIDGFNTYFVSKLARENGIKACVSGIGGDELFGGYTSFLQSGKMLKFKRFKSPLKIISNFLRYDKKEKLNYFLSNPELETAFFSIRGLLTPQMLKRILKYKKINFDPLHYINNILNSEDAKNLGIINRISLLELRIYMHNQLLRDTDNFSMCNSLEVRVPLLDPELVEFCFSIEPEYKINKKILKELMKKYLPESIIKREKRGFFFPIEKWLRKELKDFLRNSLEMDTIFDKKEVLNLFKDFERGNIHWSRIWAIGILNHYLKENKLC